MLQNVGKSFKPSFSNTLWGGDVDGVTGLVRPPVSRLVALASLTASTASLGFATVELLELIAGSWVAVMTYRRRFMWLLDLILNAVKERSASDVLQLSTALKFELYTLSLVAPVICTDLRARLLSTSLRC